MVCGPRAPRATGPRQNPLRGCQETHDAVAEPAIAPRRAADGLVDTFPGVDQRGPGRAVRPPQCRPSPAPPTRRILQSRSVAVTGPSSNARSIRTSPARAPMLTAMALAVPNSQQVKSLAVSRPIGRVLTGASAPRSAGQPRPWQLATATQCLFSGSSVRLLAAPPASARRTSTRPHTTLTSGNTLNSLKGCGFDPDSTRGPQTPKTNSS